jgi:hypothetical protein
MEIEQSYGIDHQRYDLAMKILYPKETFTTLKFDGGIASMRTKDL